MPSGASLAVLLALLVVLATACVTELPPPTPEVPFDLERHTAPPGAGAGSSGPRDRVRVSGAGSQTVNLRAEPGTSGARVKGLGDGVALELLGPDRAADGRVWRHVRDPSDGVEGWVSAEFLAPVASP